MWEEIVSSREMVWLILGRGPSQPPLSEINRRRCRQLINSSWTCIRQVEGGTGFTSLRCAKVPFQDVPGLSTLGLRLSLRNLGRIKLKDCLPPFSPRLLSSPFLSKNINIKIHRIIILPVVLYGCETWSVTLREEHRLRVSENRVLRKLFGPKRDKVIWKWRKLHNEELYGLHSSPHIIRVIKSIKMRPAGNVARMEERCIQGFGWETWRKETTWKT